LSKKKLHILFLNSWYPSKVFPVNGDFIQRHAQAVARKHQVTVIHIITDTSLKKSSYTDTNIHNVRELIFYLKPSRNIFTKAKNYFQAFQKLVKKAGKFDIVHVNRLYPAGLFALYLKYTKKLPYIISEHFTGYLEITAKTFNFSELFLSKLIVKNASFTCPVSENLAQNMRKIGLNGNYVIVPNVVDTNLFFPSKKPPNQFTILHISSLVDDHKNITGILQVIRKFQEQIPDFLFYLIGDNPFQYQHYIETLGIKPENIQLVDQVTHQEIAKYLQQAKVLIMFSNFENLPCVILEAFASGVPVISTDVGGIKEFFPKDFGKLIASKNQNQLINALLEIKEKLSYFDKEKMHQYAEQHFSIENIGGKFEQLYYLALKNEV
jgi:glycosyltransferase involved in cell wall biosynthesis